MGCTSGNGRVSGEGLCPIHITLCFLIVAQMYSLLQELLPRLPTMMDCTLELDPEFITATGKGPWKEGALYGGRKQTLIHSTSLKQAPTVTLAPETLR